MSGNGLIIIGAGAAAYSAAQHLRANGYEEIIRVIGDESEPPYERPPLSKAYLAGSVDAEALAFRPRAWYSNNAIELIPHSTVTGLEPVRRTVQLNGGTALDYDKVLIATGGSPRRLPGHVGERIVYLRTLADADTIAAHLRSGARITILGGGFIGAEVAATARRKGAEVTIIEALDVPMQRALGEEIGRVYAEIHRDEGVRLELRSTLETVRQSSTELRLGTSRGVEIACDLLVVGIGLEPNVAFLKGSGVDLDNGVLVNEFAETNVPGVYAVGDVANHWHPLFERRMRVEHHDNALQQAVAAMNHLLGHEEAYTMVHWVWSDQYEHNLQFAGSNTGCDEIVLRGSVADRKFAAFYLRQGRLMAVLGVNSGREVIAARRLIGKTTYCDAKALADENVKLKDTVRR